jgi:hypothetical protein
VSAEDQGAIMALLDTQGDTIGFEELREAYVQIQQVLMWVVQYSQPMQEVQMVCDHPRQIINLQWQITDLQKNQFLPLQWDLQSESNGYRL